MLSSGASLSQQPINDCNKNNNGIIGHGSYNIVASGNSHVGNFTQIVPQTEGEDVELDKLLGAHVSKDALRNSFHSPPECHPNTRTTIRNEIGGWIDESASKKSPLLWLYGPAAVGKSVIAKTVSGFHDEIVATFFFSTSSDKTAATLFPTLAWQLARRIPDTRKYIIASLKNSHSLQTSQIEEQFDRLIIQPLRNITVTASGSRPVMVIDGVDECTDERMMGRFLRILMQAAREGRETMPVRFIICSRPEPQIHAILGKAYDVTEPHWQLPREELPAFRKYFTFGLLPAVLQSGLFLLISTYGVHEGIGLCEQLLFKFARQSFGSTAFLGLLLISLVCRQIAKIGFSTAMQQLEIRGFLQDVWELYRPIPLDVNKNASFSDPLVDTRDRICYHPVISTIPIIFTEECKIDIARYLTDNFNAFYQQESWFQKDDIEKIVEASCGQFLYASTIVRLLDEPYVNPSDVLKMVHRSSVPAPDLDKLYIAILKRAQDRIGKQVQEGSSEYRTEWRFVRDSLSLLAFFTGNAHFFTIRRNVPVIEVLLRLNNRELNKKLCSMHSVLRIVDGESVSVYHRSFLEFLLNRNRSREYHISYPNASRHVFILAIRAELRYVITRSLPWLKIDDVERLELVRAMITACSDNFFGRSRYSNILSLFHGVVHLLIPVSMLHLFLSKLLSIYLRPLQPLIIIFFEHVSFIFSLATYTFFLNRSVTVPFFHPFLHPLLMPTSGFILLMIVGMAIPLVLNLNT